MMNDTYSQVMAVIQGHRQHVSPAGTILYALPVEHLLDMPAQNPLRDLIADRAEKAGIAAGLIDPNEPGFYDNRYIRVTIQGHLVVAELVEVALVEPENPDDM